MVRLILGIGSGHLLSAGDEGDHDVGGVLVEVGAAVVVADGGSRVGVAGRDLDVPERTPAG